MGINILKIEDPKDDCKGKIYKYVVNTYVDYRGNYTQKSTMRLLKRKSCKGCQKCDWFEEAIQQHEYDMGDIFIEKPKNNALYTIIAISGDIDYETGYPDGYELEFRRIKTLTD